MEDFRTRPLDAGPYTFVAADALVLKVREGGRVVNVHALLAAGVNADGLDQAAVGVGGDQRDAGQAAGGQVAEERQPSGAVLGGGDLQAQDLPGSMGVHPHC